ncbi:MAG TPA: serine/threonine-protein kinase, partial [Gemmatales bacterium]|nr:serine/threonine-protein kinase [Gemmatales bacterium]
ASDLIGRYELRAVLGEGTFGKVYLAYDPKLEREVALKVLRRELMGAKNAIARLLREAKAAAKMHHPHIVPLYDAGKVGSVYFIAAAYIPGENLANCIPPEGMDPRRAARIVSQLAQALGYAHRQGVLHRDVKPANAMLDEEDQVYLMDFGLAAWLEQEAVARITTEGVAIGTPAFMAPEAARRRPTSIGPASDQYSAGVVLYQLLTGRLPFDGPAPALVYHLLHSPPPRVSEWRLDIDPVLEDICMRTLAKEAEERFESCEELSQALELWLATQPPLPPPLPTVVLPALPSPNEVTPLGIDVNGTSATTIPDLLASGKKVEPWLSPEVRQWAEAGYAPAQNYFARCLRQGVGVPRDPMQAVWWFVAAAEQGHPAAQFELGHCYAHGVGVSADERDAFRWYRAAADQGYPPAQRHVGLCLARGAGARRDLDEAVRWYRAAAQQGDAGAQILLALAHEAGEGAVQSYLEAQRWLRLAAEQDEAAAQYHLGRIFDEGLGVPTDRNEALRWYRRAALQGHPDAKQRLIELRAAQANYAIPGWGPR